jgi:hypothetical protein
MEGAAGKAAVRQVAIECANTEGKLGVQTLLPAFLPALQPLIARQQQA